MIEVYTSELPDRIREKIENVERLARKRKLLPRHIEEALAALEQRREGHIIAHGGGVAKSYGYPAESTWLDLAWFSHRRVKYVRWRVVRTNAPQPPWPELNFRDDAWEIVFPDRAARYKMIKIKRALRPLNIITPADAIKIKQQWKKTRLVLVKDKAGKEFLCSPLGAQEIPYFTGSIKEALAWLKIEATSHSTWEEVEPQWILATLSR